MQALEAQHSAPTTDPVLRRIRLGGMLNFYYKGGRVSADRPMAH
jgi:hypothetical protein